MADCIVQRPDPQALFNRVRDRFSSTVLGGGTVVPESNEWYVVSNDYAMMEEYYAIADQFARENDPRYACCDNLYRIAARAGVYPRAASFAQGYAQLTGTPGAPLSNTMEMQYEGKTYRVTGNMPAEIGLDGTAIVRFRALEAGSGSNISGGQQTGTLTAPPAGVDATVIIYGGQFCGGTDEETCEEFRNRYLTRMQYKPRATANWLREKLAEWPCVTRVCDRAGECCVPGEDCPDCSCANCADNNAFQFYVMFDSTFDCGAAPACVLAEIQEWLFGPDGQQGRGLGEAPLGVCGSIHVFTPQRFDVRVDASVCLSISQQQALRAVVQDYLKFAICPSLELPLQNLELVVGQVIGLQPGGFSVVIEPHEDATGLAVDPCGNMIPLCDVLPCVDQITFTGPTFDAPCG